MSNITQGMQAIIDATKAAKEDLISKQALAVSNMNAEPALSAINVANKEVQDKANHLVIAGEAKKKDSRRILNNLMIVKRYNTNVSIINIRRRVGDSYKNENKIIKKALNDISVAKHSKTANKIGNYGLSEITTKSSGFKFPVKPTFCLNGSIVDCINGIKPVGYDTVTFNNDGTFSNPDKTCCGQIVDGESLWVGKGTENIFKYWEAYGQGCRLNIRDKFIYIKYNSFRGVNSGGFDIYLAPFNPLFKNKNYYVSLYCNKPDKDILTFTINGNVGLSPLSKITETEYGTLYGYNYKSIPLYGAYNCIFLQYVPYTVYNNSTAIEINRYQIEEGDYQTPFVFDKRENIILEYDRVSSDIIYIELIGGIKLTDNQFILASEHFEIKINKDFGKLLNQFEKNIIIFSIKNNKCYVNGLIVDPALFHIINSKSVLSFVYNGYIHSFKSINGVYPMDFTTNINDDGTFNNNNFKGQITDRGIFIGRGTTNIARIDNNGLATVIKRGRSIFLDVPKGTFIPKDVGLLMRHPISVSCNPYNNINCSVTFDSIPGLKTSSEASKINLCFGVNGGQASLSTEIKNPNTTSEYTNEYTEESYSNIGFSIGVGLTEQYTIVGGLQIHLKNYMVELNRHNTPYVEIERAGSLLQYPITMFPEYIFNSVIYFEFIGKVKSDNLGGEGNHRLHILSSSSLTGISSQPDLGVFIQTLNTALFTSHINKMLVINNKTYINGVLYNISTSLNDMKGLDYVEKFITVLSHFSGGSNCALNAEVTAFKLYDKRDNPSLWTEEFCKNLTL